MQPFPSTWPTRQPWLLPYQAIRLLPPHLGLAAEVPPAHHHWLPDKGEHSVIMAAYGQSKSDKSLKLILFFSIQIISAPFKIPKTQASCNLMALADSPVPTKMLTDARDICAHHCSPYLGGRPAAPEASRTFGR